MNLPQDFLIRMKAELGAGFESFLKSYENEPARAVRVNTLKVSVDEFKKISPVLLEGRVPWEKSGFYTLAEGLGKTDRKSVV